MHPDNQSGRSNRRHPNLKRDPMMKNTRRIGLFACTAMFVLYLILVFFNPYVPRVALTLPIAVSIGLSLAGLMVTLKTKPYLMVLVAVALFIPIGFYLLGTPGIFRWIGIFNIVFLFSALLMLVKLWGTKSRKFPNADDRM